jgi:hypothetical protein
MGNQTATFEALSLKSNTGLVQAILENDSVIAGNLTLKTTTGAVVLRMNHAIVRGNETFNLDTSVGALTMDIVENQSFSGNVQVNAATTTGEVSLEMNIDNDVGAQITSQTEIGSINPHLNNFSGNKSCLQ